MFTRRAPQIPGENAISELKAVMIGDVEQWIYIRGENKDHPILLMLHGGPGTGQIGFMRKIQVELEEDFVVVQWDQRGSGLSYAKQIPPESMHIDQLVRDTIEVTKYVLNRLDRQQLYLVGHSWGTILGMLAISHAPELYKRYFGVAQVTNVELSNRLSYTKLLEKTQLENNVRAYKQLLNIGPPPWYDLKHDRIHQKYIEALGGGITRDGKIVRKILANLITSKEYTIRDCMHFIQGQFFSMKHLQEEMEKTNLENKVNRVNVPIYFLMGKHDLMIPFETAKKYFNNIKAPEKQWIMFENSAHSPILEEPKKFKRLLLTEVKKDYIGK